MFRTLQLLKGIMEGWKEGRKHREKGLLGEEENSKAEEIQRVEANTSGGRGLIWGRGQGDPLVQTLT